MVSAPDPAVTQPGVQSRWPHLPEPRSRKCQARRRRRGAHSSRRGDSAWRPRLLLARGFSYVFSVTFQNEEVPDEGGSCCPQGKDRRTCGAADTRLRAREEGTPGGGRSLRTAVPPALPREHKHRQRSDSCGDMSQQRVTLPCDLSAFPSHRSPPVTRPTYFARQPQPRA